MRFRSLKPKRSLARTQKPAEGSVCDNSGLRGFSFSAQTAFFGQEWGLLPRRGCFSKEALVDDRWGQHCYVFGFQYFYGFSLAELLVSTIVVMLLLERESMPIDWQAGFWAAALIYPLHSYAVTTASYFH